MKCVVMNPNTTRAMTDAVVAELRPRLPAGTQIIGLTARSGSPVIHSRETFAMGAASAMAMLPEVPDNADGILLACFGDPGLDALRRSTSVPVIGLAQAAMNAARRQERRFAIITAGADWVAMLRECAAANGVADLLVDVYALQGHGGQLLQDPEAFRTQVAALSSRAADDGAQLLLLGGAAFTGLAFAVDPRVTVMNAMDAAVECLVQAAHAPAARRAVPIR